FIMEEEIDIRVKDNPRKLEHTSNNVRFLFTRCRCQTDKLSKMDHHRPTSNPLQRTVQWTLQILANNSASYSKYHTIAQIIANSFVFDRVYDLPQIQSDQRDDQTVKTVILDRLED
ncbi:unnamed protein product, partial [Heterotrigona itama]